MAARRARRRPAPRRGRPQRGDHGDPRGGPRVPARPGVDLAEHDVRLGLAGLLEHRREAAARSAPAGLEASIVVAGLAGLSGPALDGRGRGVGRLRPAQPAPAFTALPDGPGAYLVGSEWGWAARLTAARSRRRSWRSARTTTATTASNAPTTSDMTSSGTQSTSRGS